MLDGSLESGMFSTLPSDVDAAGANRHLNVANEAVQRIKYARYIGFGLGVLVFIQAAIIAYGGVTDEAIGVVAQGALYVALAYGSVRAPMSCLGVLLAIYLADHVYTGFATPKEALSGAAVKVALVIFLGRGVVSAYRLRQSRAALRELGMAPGQLEPLARLEPVPLVTVG